MNARTMRVEVMRKRLLEAGKRHTPTDRVPFAFEQRIMARIRGSNPLDPWLLWNRILWRFAGPCVALTLLFGAFTWLGQTESPNSETLILELETVLYAPLSTPQEVW